MAREFVKLGYTIGLGGPVTFKKCQNPERGGGGRDLAHLQIETDCPYLTPVPYRGKTERADVSSADRENHSGIARDGGKTLKQSLWDNYQALFHPQDEL